MGIGAASVTPARWESIVEGSGLVHGKGAARRVRLPVGASALALVALLGTLLGPAGAGAWDYSTPKIDFLGEEVMRLVNLDRRGNERAALYADKTLINLARDLAFACPTKSSLTIRGRARDFADRDYFTHYVKGCYKSGKTLYSIIDLLASPFGYTRNRGENILRNAYGVSATSYKWGCDASGYSCNGTTTTAKTVASAEYWWMHSSVHRGNILGDYDRFGCGVWLDGDGTKLFVCLFAKGGPNPLDTTRPVVKSATGDGASVARGSSITLSATVADNFRLSDGWVRLDPTSTCGGPVLHAWAYNLNVSSNVHSFTWNTTGVAKGKHAIAWRVRDVATLRSSCYVIHLTVT